MTAGALDVLDPSSLFRRARKIELLSRRLVETQLAGPYRSIFKGRGLSFAGVRPYAEGDDVRTIDWNVSARLNLAHVKQFVEERDRTVQLVVDVSASGLGGAGPASKRDIAAELAALLALSAIKHNDRVGLTLVTDRVERYIAPEQGRRHVMRLVAEILTHRPAHRGTNLAVAFDFLVKVAGRRSLVFVLSDFLAQDWDRSLRIATRRHEIVPIVMTDPLEYGVPHLGLVQVQDLETGEVREIDSDATPPAPSDDPAQRHRLLTGAGLQPCVVSTDGSHADALIRYLRRRSRSLGA